MQPVSGSYDIQCDFVIFPNLLFILRSWKSFTPPKVLVFDCQQMWLGLSRVVPGISIQWT
jgi:hypothetical protein